MNSSILSYPRYLIPEPMTDPPWIRKPLAGRGPPTGTGPP